MPVTSKPSDLPRLDALLARVDRLFELPEETLRRAAPEVSTWSAGEHLFHITLANDLSLKNALNLIAGRGRLRRERKPLHPRAAEVLERGVFPPGAQAPRFVTPPPQPDLTVARDIQREVTAAARQVREQRAELEAAPQGIPHQILGVLSAAEWVRFARAHTAHHLGIARRVLAGAPA